MSIAVALVTTSMRSFPCVILRTKMSYVDSHGVFLAGVRVLHFFPFGKVAGKVPTAAMLEEKRDFIARLNRE